MAGNKAGMKIIIATIAVVTVLLLVFLLFLKNTFTPRGQDKFNKVKFLLDWKAGPEFIGYIVAKDKQFYLQEGIDVELIEGTGAVDSAKLVAAGTYGLGVSSAAAVLEARAQRAPLFALAVIFQKSPVVILSIKENNIVRPSDLKGKRIGVHYGSSEYLEYRAMMNALNIPLLSVQEVGIGFDVQALLSGQIDAQTGYTQNAPNQVRLAGREVNQIFVEDWGVKIYSSLIIANGTFLATNNELARKIVRASLRGWQYSLDHTEEAIKVVLNNYPILDEKFVRACTRDTLGLIKRRDVGKHSLGHQEIERWRNLREIMLAQGVIKDPIEIEAFVTMEYLPGR